MEVDTGALRANFGALRERVGSETRLIPMVKADGYGLGAVRVARALEPLDPWGFGVAAGEEGVELRTAGIDRPILVAAPLAPGGERTAAEAGLIPSVSDLAGVERWASAAASTGRDLELHVEVDTGMGRCGFQWERAAEWAPSVLERLGPRVRWTGIFTHFQGADDPSPNATITQWERFRQALEAVERAVGDRLRASLERSGVGLPLMVHACNSAGVVRFPELAADAVRPGIFLYGAAPAPAIPTPEATRPRPVAAVRARLLLVRDVPEGATVGYGATHRAERTERWGTLGIGYGDGLPRALGNRGAALVRGRRVPIVGRVSMDLTVVDLTDLPDAVPGDVATLIGSDGGAAIPVEEVAAQAGTISYEILTGLTRRLPRVEVSGSAEPEPVALDTGAGHARVE